MRTRIPSAIEGIIMFQRYIFTSIYHAYIIQDMKSKSNDKLPEIASLGVFLSDLPQIFRLTLIAVCRKIWTRRD